MMTRVPEIPSAGRTLLTALVALLASALVVSCATETVRLATPTGFAEYQDSAEYSIVSPEGVDLRVRTVANDPPQTLDFWAAAMKRHLAEGGYALLADGTFSPRALPAATVTPDNGTARGSAPAAPTLAAPTTTGSGSAVTSYGVFYEWSAPVGTEDFTYLTAIALTGDRIVIVEAAGPIEYYQKRAAAIHAALDTVAPASR